MKCKRIAARSERKHIHTHNNNNTKKRSTSYISGIKPNILNIIMPSFVFDIAFSGLRVYSLCVYIYIYDVMAANREETRCVLFIGRKQVVSNAHPYIHITNTHSHTHASYPTMYIHSVYCKECKYIYIYICCGFCMCLLTYTILHCFCALSRKMFGALTLIYYNLAASAPTTYIYIYNSKRRAPWRSYIHTLWARLQIMDKI